MRHQNISVTGSLNLNGVGVATTANLNAFTASSDTKVDALIVKTGSYATTGSNTFTGAQIVQGTLTAQTLVVQTVTSSVLYTTGSNIIGSSLSNIQQITGSFGVTGSATFSNSLIANSANGIGGTFRSNTFFGSIDLENTGGDIAGKWNVQSVSGTQVGGSAGSSFGIYSYNTSAYRLWVNLSGSVGIGTTSPGSTLPTGSSTLINNGWTFSGPIVASRKVLEINSNDNNGGNVGLFLRQLNKSVGLDIWADNYYGNSYIDNRFDDASAYISFRLRTANLANIVQPFTIVASGYVGIGTTTPASQLEIFTSQYQRIQTYFSSPYTSGFKFSDLNGQIIFNAGTDNMNIVSNSAGGNITLGTAGTTRLTIANDGAATFQSSITATSLSLSSTANSTSPSSGAATIGGGLGLRGDLFLNQASANGSNYGYIKTTATTANTTTLTLGTTYGYATNVDAVTFYNGGATFTNSIQTPAMYGRYFTPTSTAGSTAYIDTGIALENSAVYLLTVTGNPAAAGGLYSYNEVGLININSNYNGSSNTQIIKFTRLSINNVNYYPNTLTLSVVFLIGGSEVTQTSSYLPSGQIRIKLEGYYNTTGYGTAAYVTRLA